MELFSKRNKVKDAVGRRVSGVWFWGLIFRRGPGIARMKSFVSAIAGVVGGLREPLPACRRLPVGCGMALIEVTVARGCGYESGSFL